MKPERSRDRLRSAAVARGRMFLKAKLAWLPGYPIGQVVGGVNWQPVPKLSIELPPATCLRAEQLQQATYTWTKLVHRFPRALPYLVDDADRWKEGVPQLLEPLKSAIHHAKLLPDSLLEQPAAYPRNVRERVLRLAERAPSMVPLLDAMSWHYFLNLNAFGETLA